MVNPIINSMIYRSWIPNLSGDIISSQPFKKLQSRGQLNNISEFENRINSVSPYYRLIKSYNGVNKKYHYINEIDPNDNRSGPVLLYALLFDNGLSQPTKIILFLFTEGKYEFLSEVAIQDLEPKGLITLKPINYSETIDKSTSNVDCIKSNIDSHLNIAYAALREFYHKHTHHYGEYKLKNDADYLTGISNNPDKKEAIKEIVLHFKKQIDIHHEELALFDLSTTDDKYNILKNFKTSLKARRTATGCFLYAKNLLHFYKEELGDDNAKYVQEHLEIFNQALFSIKTMGEYIHDLHTGYLSEKTDEVSGSINKFSQILVRLTWVLITLTGILIFLTILTVLKTFQFV